MSTMMIEAGMAPEDFQQRLMSERKSYHLEHPLEVSLASGKLTHQQLQKWVANRFYYQAAIPRKDAAILSNCWDADFRRRWIQRILDQDGVGNSPGGQEAWLKLASGVGLTREETLDFRHVLPGVRFAVDAYVNFARTAPWQEAVAASLTELFAPEAHRRRIDAFGTHYLYVPDDCLTYFRQRLVEARRDVDHGLTITLSHFTSALAQDRVLEILRFKLDILWTLAETVYRAHVCP